MKIIAALFVALLVAPEAVAYQHHPRSSYVHGVYHHHPYHHHAYNH